MAVPRDPTIFERTADMYSKVRPGDPDELVDFVVDRAGLAPGARLLEFGCGPGLATEPFAQRGYSIVAVDQSERMLANARRRLAEHPQVRFVHARFEDWPGDAERFDLVYAGMAWHWLPPDGRDAKVLAALRDGGAVAILVHWPLSVWEEGQDLYEAHWPNHQPSARRTVEERLDGVTAELASHGVFELRDVSRHPWSVEHTADGFVDVLNTYSDLAALPDEVQRRFLAAVRERVAQLGGVVRRSYEAVAMLARPL